MNDLKDSPLTLNYSQAAKLLGVSRYIVRDLVKSGRLETVTLMRQPRVLKTSIARLLELRAQPSDPAQDRKMFDLEVQRGAQLEPRFSNFTERPGRELIDRLWTSLERIPNEICEMLVMPHGTRYTEGARELRRWLAAQAARQAA